MAVDAFFNFGSGAAASTNKTWNEGDLANVGERLADILNAVGASTGWSLWCTAARSGTSNSGVNAIGTGDAAWVDEAIVSDTFEYASAGNVVSMEFRGLDDAKTYDIELFSSWASSGNRRIEISFDNFSTVAGTLEASLNSTQTIQVAGLSPSSGVIALSFRPLSGDSYAHCNAIWLQENDAAAATGRGRLVGGKLVGGNLVGVH